MPIIGEVPMSKYYQIFLICLFIVFYIPECGEHYDNLKTLIEDHGGMVVDQHECFTYQIRPDQAKLKMKDFYQGQIYLSSWITSAIDKN